MIFPWIKLTTASLNAGVATTVGGAFTYFLLGGQNKEEKEKIDEFLLQIKKEWEQFEIRKKDLEKEETISLGRAKNELLAAKEVGDCLEKTKKTYEKEIADLTVWDSIFSSKLVRYVAEHCEKKVET